MNMLTEFGVELFQLKQQEAELTDSKYNLLKRIVEAFTEKYDTNTIYFDYESMKFGLYCHTFNGEIYTYIKSITFNEHKDIDLIVGVDESGEEYSGEDWNFESIDILQLAEYINDQLKDRYLLK